MASGCSEEFSAAAVQDASMRIDRDGLRSEVASLLDTKPPQQEGQRLMCGEEGGPTSGQCSPLLSHAQPARRFGSQAVEGSARGTTGVISVHPARAQSTLGPG